MTRERKVITVLFADLVGFTSTAEQLDPEDVEKILRPYHERLRYELERWGGTVEKFIGDAVVAFFGAPVAGENDQERAVRAALEIRDWIAEEGKLQVRIAVNTGEALVNLAARPESGEGMATGDVVNTAARMQSAAPVDGILVGETTYRATSDRIEYRGHEPVEAKGKEAPIPVWEVVQARARFGVDLAPETRTPLVGRERELDQLVDALARVREQGSPELVTLVGVPGIGKSRLVGELFQSIERGDVLVFWRQGRSLPYGEGVSYWALAEMVKAQAGILETDSDEEVEAKLLGAVEQLIDDDAEWVLSHLRPLAGQGEASGSQEEAFAAWRRFFEAMAEQRPLVLVFEDIQWADDGLLDFIEHLADWVSDVPMLVLCTARRELLERRPTWSGGKDNAATIALAPLTDDQVGQLVSALGVDVERVLLERAGGNPLYAEQFVRMLDERETVDQLPETVQGIIAARLDSLPPDEKALVQNAAVVGKVFWLGSLGATERQLHALQQKELVQRARRTSVEGETEYAFKHLLVRDVAYGQIPRADRAQKHVAAAEWIASLGRPEDLAEMLAHHNASALELARAADEDVADLVPRAREAFRDAGIRAATLHALAAADRYYEDALELTPDDHPDRADLLYRLGDIRWHRFEEGGPEFDAAREAFLARGDDDRAAECELRLAQVSWRLGDSDGVRAHMERARSLVDDTTPSRVHAAVLTEVSRYAMLAGRDDEAISAGRQAIRIAEQLGLDDLRVQALNNVGTARANAGDLGGMLELEESVAFAKRINLIGEVVRGLNNIGASYVINAQPAKGNEKRRELRALAVRYGYHGFVRFTDGGPGIAHAYQAGDWEEALALADRFIAEVEAGSPHYQAATAYPFRALIRLARDDEAGALADAEHGRAVAAHIDDPQAFLAEIAFCGLVYDAVGDPDRVTETVDEALASFEGLAHMGFGVVVACELAWLCRRLGRENELSTVVARETAPNRWLDAVRAALAGDLHRAAEVLDEIGARPLAAFYRLQAASEADVRLALDFYRSVGAVRYIRECEALLAVKA